MQNFKTVYFADYPRSGSTRSGLTIPFAQADAPLFHAVAGLSSHTVRTAIGHQRFHDLARAAERVGSSPSCFARDRLRSVMQPRGRTERGYDAAIQSTFAGGRGSPLHDWFPYLEGYSPDFVRSVIGEYAADARTVIDPFCGSGTTALTAASMGLDAGYCEVNPVCRMVIDAKALAIRLDPASRRSIADALETVAGDLAAATSRTCAADDLRTSFATTFGERPFFDPATLRDVLALRTIVDDVAAEDVRTAALVEVAVLGCLVANSLLVRRGDLRFRTDAENATRRPDILADVSDRLRLMASDLLDLDVASGSIALLTPDIRNLDRMEHGVFDAAITSPPYLNGTNYFRNTKIELWFARHLTKKGGLRSFRNAAITSGINDVTNDKAGSRPMPDDELLMQTLGALEASAYDQRIPKMAASYFAEMEQAFGRLHRVCATGASLAIDLGDSCYGDVHVRTDLILRHLLEKIGFDFEHEVLLRERASRSGRPLRQTLQVFRAR